MKIPRANTLFALAVLLAALNCRQAAPQTEVSPSPTASHPPNPSSLPTQDRSSLWYLTRGGAKLDQGWGVDLDAGGNVYFATYQQAQEEPFTDMVIYRLDSDGEERWQAHWGGKFVEKAFVAAAAGPLVSSCSVTIRTAACRGARPGAARRTRAPWASSWSMASPASPPTPTASAMARMTPSCSRVPAKPDSFRRSSRPQERQPLDSPCRGLHSSCKSTSDSSSGSRTALPARRNGVSGDRGRSALYIGL